MEKHQKLSVFISLILRHKPETIGLTLDDQGYLEVDQLIKGVNESGRFIDENILEEIVMTDNKQRYSYNVDGSKIRANQGHSIQVNLGLLECKPPDKLYHGTVDKYVDSIVSTGLQKKSRQYVHLSENIDTATSVGSRRCQPVILTIKSGEMYKDGIKFYKSENNVWLVDFIDGKYLEMK